MIANLKQPKFKLYITKLTQHSITWTNQVRSDNVPVVTLLEHLRNTRKTFDVGIGNKENDVLIRGIEVDCYEVTDSYLWLRSSTGHEVKVNLEQFKDIQFNAIVSTAQSSVAMLECFSKLTDSKKYNAYFRNNEEEYIMDLYNIPSKY